VADKGKEKTDAHRTELYREGKSRYLGMKKNFSGGGPTEGAKGAPLVGSTLRLEIRDSGSEKDRRSIKRLLSI